MTREQAKRRAELYLALAEGKTLQSKVFNDEWVDLKIEDINYLPDNINFRIKQ